MGTITNNGEIDIAATGTLENAGTKITNANTIKVAAGGTVTATSGTWDGTGTYEVKLTITADLYVHVLDGTKIAGMKKMDEV